MAKQVRIDLNSKEIEKLLKSEDVQDELRRRAERVRAAAGPGHDLVVDVGRSRARATVSTRTRAAKLAEARNRNLTRAAQAAGGE